VGNNQGSQTGRPESIIKDYSHNNLQKNTELKAALTGSTVRQKAKEERRLLYAPILKLQKGMVSGLTKSVMSENQNSQSQVHATASRYLRFKPGKRGLNTVPGLESEWFCAVPYKAPQTNCLSLRALKFRQYQHETHTNKQKKLQGTGTLSNDAIIIFKLSISVFQQVKSTL
jgi:hypothetical protein